MAQYNRKTYMAISIGEVIRGTKEELAASFGVSTYYIVKLFVTGKAIKRGGHNYYIDVE